MSQHFGIGGCQGTKGDIAHLSAPLIPKNTMSVNSLTGSQTNTIFSMCLFVLRMRKS